MNKITKVLIWISIVALIFIFVIYQALHMMEVEDRYGDLQEIYNKSESGYILFNNLNEKSGRILIEKNRIYIIDKDKKFELEDWLDPNSKMKYDLTVYGNNSKSNTKLHLKFEY